MSWETYWAPNLVQWIVGGALTALVGAVVGFLFRRWLRQLVGEQRQTRAFAETAAVSSIESADAAKQAARHASTANESAITALSNSQQVNEAVVFLAKQLGAENDRSEYLAEQTNRLLGALARERARNPIDEDPDAVLTITGRHRLHTALIDTGALRQADQETS